MSTIITQADSSPITVCSLNDLVEGSGVAAKIEQNQIALFYLPADALSTNSPQVFALNNYDPIGKANVLARGIVGDVGGEPVVASPLYKQHFSLITGCCIEQPDVSVKTYKVEIFDDLVQIWLQ
ncbi:MAG: nitrite reductase (NADH) small subunit [Candidatus Azotimanducaceae bacterium]|jgi:nitrite reductase (NADH) small subunit